MNPKLPKKYKKNPVRMTKDLIAVLGNDGMREYERIVFLKHIGSAIGPASLICLIMFAVAIYKEYKIVTLFCLVFSAASATACIFMNHEMWTTLNDVIEDYLGEKTTEETKSKPSAKK